MADNRDASWSPELTDQIRRLVHSVAVGMLPSFSRFREYDLDDLVSEGIAHVRRQWPKYDPERGAISTFVCRVAGTQLLFVLRGLNRRLNRETNVTRERQWAADRGRPLPPTFIAAADEAVLLWEQDDRDLADWLSDLRIKTRHACPVPKARRGRRWFSLSQVAATAALMERLDLSIRGVRALLLEREDLRRALRLRHVPAASWFVAASKFRAQIRKNREAARGHIPE